MLTCAQWEHPDFARTALEKIPEGGRGGFEGASKGSVCWGEEGGFKGALRGVEVGGFERREGSS